MRLLATPLLLVLAACSAAPELRRSPASDANDNLNAVAWMQTSAEYRALAEQTWRGAADALDAALADPQWNALLPGDRAADATALPPAVVVDVDETVLDNSPYQARLVRDGLQYDDATWAAWVREEAARAVPGALAFARAASERGITIVYITNRDADLAAPTLANLRALGFPVGEAGRVFYGKGREVAGCTQPGSDKGCRRRAVAREYRVLLQVGDQVTDFGSVGHGRDAQAQFVTEHAGWIGSRWWILPNPSYGGWEPALFDNDWSLPAEARRAAKLDALESVDTH
ncbi:5'-nucleotidase, lipoprotein e(P4) family [Coralloluteibacterium stylophorae]|uniref:Acid phosphatase n=1 Tax=Coralloluteibacterium stylophorae TaxID=1776034 RepID=A0AAP2CAR9_9GAMM|nr:HAD family acid phosphatase [Coralloluteibacterium stylophorae]MBS7457107.1 acid phosphatase [Coralloluteibacterium stylophorae]